MRRPVQALEVANNAQVWYRIINQEKQISIREGHRDYVLGKMVIFTAESNRVTVVEVIEVRHTTMNEVTLNEMKDDGYNGKEEMMNDLREYYPGLTWDSPVTIIHWSLVPGYWTRPDIRTWFINTNLDEILE